jgi:DNA-binding NarL/FixJ family response regulator
MAGGKGSRGDDFIEGSPAGRESLTRAEIRVLERLVQGETNAEIALALGRKTRTVKNVVSSILSKLGARSRTEAAVMAVRSESLLTPRSTPTVAARELAATPRSARQGHAGPD